MTAPGRSPHRSGFSLTELMLAFALLAFAIVPIYSVLVASAPGVKQTLPYFQGIFFGDFAVEEARQRSHENPFAFPDHLGGLGQERARLDGGDHPYLAALEDTRVPWGRILEGQDLPLDPAYGSLHRLASPLHLRLESTIGTAADSNSPEAVVRGRFDWEDQRGKRMEYSLATPVLTWTPRDRIETDRPPVSEEELLDMLGSSAASVATVAQDRQADLPRFRAVLTVMKLVGYGRDTREALDRVAETLRSRIGESATPRRQVKWLRKLSSHEERAVAHLFSIAQDLEGPFAELALDLPPGSLGTPGFPPERLAQIGTEVAAFFQTLDVTLRQAIRHAGQVQATPGQTLRERSEATRRCWRLLRFEHLLSATVPESDLVAFLGDMVDLYRGRLPQFVAFLERERELLPTLDQSFPLMPGIRILQQVRAQSALVRVRLMFYR